PTGQFEIPLTVFTRAFFTDGELNFPPDRGTLSAGNEAPDNIAYWTPAEKSDTVEVNGVAWPNLNVQRRQYRFRLLAAGNNELFFFQFENESTGDIIPFTLIGSDGGYLPAPVATDGIELGITERADILVDFSQFPAGTKIRMINTNQYPDTALFSVMRFAVQSGTAVHPPALNPALFP